MKFLKIFKKKKNDFSEHNINSSPQLIQASNLFALSDIGIDRMENEDFTMAGINEFKNQILFVCDGLGGYEGGKMAAEIVGKNLIDKFIKFNFEELTLEQIKEWFVETINESKSQMSKHIHQEPNDAKMATTLALVIANSKQIYCFNIGDSRIYGIKKDEIFQISKDHNFYNYLVDNNVDLHRISNYGSQIYAIVNYVGQSDELELKYDCFIFDYQEFDWIIITSDGVHNFITPDEIKLQILTTNNITNIADNIIKKALASMSNDNLSVALTNLRNLE